MTRIRKWFPVITIIVLVVGMGILGARDYLQYEQQTELARWQAGFQEGVASETRAVRNHLVKTLDCYPIASQDGPNGDYICGVRVSKQEMDAALSDDLSREQ